jgi:hypothetical protein
MAEETEAIGGPARSKDEIALELMKFVSITTGYGKGAPAAGFSGKPSRNPEDYADALLQLYERCRAILYKDVASE